MNIRWNKHLIWLYLFIYYIQCRVFLARGRDVVTLGDDFNVQVNLNVFV